MSKAPPKVGGNPVTDNLDLWTSALLAKSTAGRGGNGKIEAYGIKKLRELILDLAVRGKLVPQNPHDERASELLARINEEKTRLTKMGVIRKQKSLTALSVDDCPFDTPSCWSWTLLGEVTNYGFSDKAEPKDVDEDTWVLELEDVEKVSSLLLHKARFKERRFKSSKNRFRKDDVIYGKLRPYLDKVLVADEDGVCTTEMVPFRGYCGIDSRYLRLLLKSSYFVQYANSSTHGMNLPRLGTDKARSAPIPIAPLNEQHRIVAKVDELMALCDQLEQQQTDGIAAHQTLVETLLGTLTSTRDHSEFQEAWTRIAEHFDTLFTTEHSIDQLKQTILQLAVMGKLVPQDPNDRSADDLLKRVSAAKESLLKSGAIRKQKVLAALDDDNLPFNAPSSWRWVRMDDVMAISGGVTLGRKITGKKTVTAPYLRVANVQRGHLLLDNIKKITVLAEELDKYSLKERDLLITEGGDWDKVGRTATWHGEIDGCLHQNHIFRARPLSTDWNCRWVELWLNGPFARDYFAGSAKQTTNLASINMTQLRSCAIPVPPPDEQLRIVSMLDELSNFCDILRDRIVSARMTQSYLADAIVEQAAA